VRRWLRGVRGARCMTEGDNQGGLGRLVLLEMNACEAAASSEIEAYRAGGLREAVEFLASGGGVEPGRPPSENGHEPEVELAVV
jgi:hypothetical protein